MITKESVLGQYEYLKMVQLTTLDVIAAFPDEKLDWHPKEDMRSPRELIEHIYGQAVAKLKAAKRGTMTLQELMDEHNAPRDTGTEELIAWCRTRMDEVEKLLDGLTDEDWARNIEGFFGVFPTPTFVSITYDEWWHHRGQLTVYLRLLDISVPDIYAYPPMEQG